MKVTITVQSTQRMDGEVARDEQTVTGTLEQNGQALSLSYEQDGQTRIMATDRRITIERRGEITSTMVLEPGMTHLCDYRTPYGSLTLGVTAKHIDHALTACGGILQAAYRLDTGGGSPIDHEIKIIVKEVSC